MSEELVTVATFAGPVQAHLARIRLESAGLKAFVVDEETAGMFWYLTTALGGVKLQIAEEHADRAFELLEDGAGTAHTSGAEPEPVLSASTENGEPLKPDEEEPDEATPDQQEPVPSLESQVAEDDEPEPELTIREKNADRALRGAVFGLLFGPLQLFAFWLLVKVFVSDERLGPKHRRKALIAAAINIPMTMAWCIFFRILMESED